MIMMIIDDILDIIINKEGIELLSSNGGKGGTNKNEKKKEWIDGDGFNKLLSNYLHDI